MKQEMKVDIPLESFDANWDDDVEASRGSKTAQAKQNGRNYKTINVNKETFEEVWD